MHTAVLPSHACAYRHTHLMLCIHSAWSTTLVAPIALPGTCTGACCCCCTYLPYPLHPPSLWCGMCHAGCTRRCCAVLCYGTGAGHCPPGGRGRGGQVHANLLCRVPHACHPFGRTSMHVRGAALVYKDGQFGVFIIFGLLCTAAMNWQCSCWWTPRLRQTTRTSRVQTI